MRVERDRYEEKIAACAVRAQHAVVSLSYAIESLGHHALPRELTAATDADVDEVLRRAAAFLGAANVEIARVTSVVGGSCVPCTDVVASLEGVPLLVARPLLF